MRAENRRRRRRRVWAEASYSRTSRAAAPSAGPGVTGNMAETAEEGAMDWESALSGADASSREEGLCSKPLEKDGK